MATKTHSILLIASSLETGGAERQLVVLAKGLQERGHLVQIALFHRRGDLIEDLCDTGIEIVDLAKAGRRDVIGFLIRTLRAVRRAQPQILYSFLGGANLVAAAIRPFVRKTRFVWSVRASNMNLTSYPWLGRAAYRIECWISDLPDLIVANSSAGADHSIKNGFPAGKIVVIPNGIDTDRFRPDAELRARQRQSFGLDDGQIAVGVLARLDPMKGHPIFLKAASIAAAKARTMRFFCIGHGTELPRLMQMAEELGIGDRVVFAGETDPVVALNAIDIACSSSGWGEGFSNSIAEAMACGLPCVVTDVGDSAVIVGPTGTVVPPDSPDALAQAILAQADSLSRHNPEAPRARIIREFSQTAMISRTLDVFQQRLGI